MTDQLFAGLKVIDCASFIAAPLAATVLSDFGADVIKIEPPGEGDAYRTPARQSRRAEEQRRLSPGCTAPATSAASRST